MRDWQSRGLYSCSEQPWLVSQKDICLPQRATTLLVIYTDVLYLLLFHQSVQHRVNSQVTHDLCLPAIFAGEIASSQALLSLSCRFMLMIPSHACTSNRMDGIELRSINVPFDIQSLHRTAVYSGSVAPWHGLKDCSNACERVGCELLVVLLCNDNGLHLQRQRRIIQGHDVYTKQWRDHFMVQNLVRKRVLSKFPVTVTRAWSREGPNSSDVRRHLMAGTALASFLAFSQI